MAFYKLFYLWFCVSSGQLKKQDFTGNLRDTLYMRVIVIIIPTNLVTNSLLSFFSLSLIPKTRQIFLRFVYSASHALLQKHAEFNRFF